MTAVGIDGYRGGWVAATVVDASVEWMTCAVHSIAELLAPRTVVGIDMPIGLTEHGWRECDVLARQALGSARSRVFMTPPRAVLELGMQAPNDVVQEISHRLTGQGTSRQAMALAERILALDDALTRRPDVHVLEIHPELSFTEMAGEVLASKKSAVGVGQRLAALRPWLPDLDQVLAKVPADVPIDDALDALACAWSARRFRDGAARTLPEGATVAPFIAF